MQFVQDKEFGHKAIHLRQCPNAEGIRPGRKHLRTKPFMQDNFPMIMQFVQDEALQHKLFIRNELRTLRESVQDNVFEQEAIHSRRTPNAEGTRPGRSN